MRITIIVCLVVTIILSSCASKKYDLTIAEIPYREEFNYIPVYSKGPLGERYTWEMHCPHLLAEDPFAVGTKDSVFVLDVSQKMLNTKKGIGEVRHYRITLDLENDGRYKTLQIWSNFYELDSIKKGVYPHVLNEKEMKDLLQQQQSQ